MTQPSTAVIPQHPRIVVVVFPDGRGSLRLDDALHEIRGVNQRDAQHKAIHLVTTLAAKPQARTVRVDAHSDQGRHQLLVSPDGTVAEAQAGWQPTTATPLPVIPAGHTTAEAVALALPRQATRPISAGQFAAAGGATLLAAAVVATAAAGHVPRRQADIDLTSAGVSGTTAIPTSAATSAAVPTATSTATPTAAATQTVRTATASPTTSSTTAATAPTTANAPAVRAAAAPVAATATPTTAAAAAAASADEPIRAVLDIEATGPVHATLTIEANGQVQVQQNPASEPASAGSEAGTVPAITVRPHTPAAGAPIGATAPPTAVPTATANGSTPAPAASTASASPSTATATSTQAPTWSAADEAELDEANEAMTQAMLNADASEQQTPSTAATSTPAAGSTPTAAPTAQPTATQSTGTAKATSTPASSPASTPTSRPTSTSDTREQQPAPVPVPDGGDGEQDEPSATAAPTARAQARIATHEAESTQTTQNTSDAATSAGGWLSGASGDGADDGTLGDWRGKPIAIGGTWADQGDNQTELWSIADGGKWSGFDGALDIAPGGLMEGESWSAAASGAYDDRWRESLTKMAGLRAGKGTTYIRPFHEFNLGGWDWSVSPDQAEDFKAAWARYRAIQREVFPQAQLVYGVNVTSSGTDLDWRTTWPGKGQADVLGVDTYNGWPTISTPAEFDAQLDARGDGGIPIGLNAYSEQAREWGVPLAVPEWSGRAEMGDEAAYVQGMTEWFAKNAGTGPGQLEYEIVFNAPQDDNNFKLFGETRMPESSAAYQQAYADGVASGTAAPAAAAATEDPESSGERTATTTSTATSTPSAEATSTSRSTSEPDDSDQADQADQADQDALEEATAAPSSTTGSEQRRTTTTPAADSGGGWLSGAAGDGVVDGSLGDWRGKPVQIAGTWQDSGDAQTQMWNLSPGEEFGDWQQPLDLAPGGMNEGDSWSAAASGAYDDRWREGLTKAASYREGKGTTYIRPFHEFNGTWYPWSVAPGQEEDFKTAWGRYRAIQQEVFPSAKLVYNPNVNSTGGLDWRQSWPGADRVDALGVDMYNGSPKRYDSAEEWTSGLDATGDGGVPIGLNAYAAQAREWGVPLAVPEWSGRAEQGDDPAFITGIGTWFAENAGTGPGQLLYEVMFNVDRNEDNFRLYNGTRMPQSAEAYREAFSKPAANGSGSTSTTTTTAAASTTDDAAEDAPESEQRTVAAASRGVAADQGAAQDSEDGSGGGDGGDDGEQSTQDTRARASTTGGEADRTQERTDDSSQEGAEGGGDVNDTAGFEGGRGQDDNGDPT